MNLTAERAESTNTPRKRDYAPPTLERLGTIDELTRGQGSKNQFDSSHPPGQNKSVI
jgi:hypothetical protein